MLRNDLQWTTIPSRKNRNSFAHITDFYLGKIYLISPKVSLSRVSFFLREKLGHTDQNFLWVFPWGVIAFCVLKSKTCSRFKPIDVFTCASLFFACPNEQDDQKWFTTTFWSLDRPKEGNGLHLFTTLALQQQHMPKWSAWVLPQPKCRLENFQVPNI